MPRVIARLEREEGQVLEVEDSKGQKGVTALDLCIFALLGGPDG